MRIIIYIYSNTATKHLFTHIKHNETILIGKLINIENTYLNLPSVVYSGHQSDGKARFGFRKELYTYMHVSLL